MDLSQGIFFFDISAVIFMLVLAYLSNRLGEALRIPAYYRFLYGTAGIVLVALILDALATIIATPLFHSIALYFRFFAGAISCIVVFRYWLWVFSAFFKQ